MILGLGSLAIHCLTIAATAFPSAPDCITIRNPLGTSLFHSKSRRVIPDMVAQVEKDPEESLRSPPLDWKPLNADTFLHLLEPRQYETQPSHPRMAASVLYAQSILDPWKEQEASWSNENGSTTEWTSIIYYDTTDDQQIPLHGYMVRNGGPRSVDEDVPVLLLFPTAVGAQDVFMLYKAAQIVNADQLRHCLVMVVDLFSDSTGWLWDKETHADQYHGRREELLRHVTATPNAEPFRPVLQSRIRSALSYVRDHVTPKPTSIAVLGWCFGGHCVAELARMEESIRAMITFHGVFSGLQTPILPEKGGDDKDACEDFQARRPRKSEILICHGIHDPFVPSHELEQALSLFQFYGHTTSLLQLRARHGFTNPAQEYNDSPAFGYDAESAQKAWRQALALLVRTIGHENTR